MKPNELRIGNYVYYDKKVVFIVSIDYSGVRIFDGNGFDKITTFGLIKPIEIDEAWLLRFGFVEERHFVKDGFVIGKRIDKFGFPWANGFRNNVLYLESVHQLQNLYYSLTNIDLS